MDLGWLKSDRLLETCRAAPIWVGCAALLLALAMCGATAASSNADNRIRLERGISIHEWLNWAPLTSSGDYVWPPYKDFAQWGTVDDLMTLRELNFDFIRLSVDPGPLIASEGKRHEQAVKVLDQATRILTAAGFRVILDLHPVHQVEAWSPKTIEGKVNDPMTKRYRDAASAVAEMLTQFEPDLVALELMNEPQYYPCEGEPGRTWGAVLKELVRTSRQVAPELTLIVSGACGGGAKGLMLLDLESLDDDNIIYSFHYYTPLAFTHQGVKKRKDVKGAPWPADPSALPGAIRHSKELLDRRAHLTPLEKAERLGVAQQYLTDYIRGDWNEARVDAHFDEVIDWAREHSIPRDRLLLGEFGVLKASGSKGGALDADRLRWLREVRRGAERRGIAWAFWEYSYLDPVALSALDVHEDSTTIWTRGQ